MTALIKLVICAGICGLVIVVSGCCPSITDQQGKAATQAVTGDMVVIGEIESVHFIDNKVLLAARIDTGATTSSLGATDIVKMERDGKKWLRFTMQDKQATVVERPLSRTINIKRHNAEAQQRYVVEMNISIAGKVMKREFSLVDRGSFSFPVLIGRNILQGEFLVDVSTQNTTSALSEAGK